MISQSFGLGSFNSVALVDGLAFVAMREGDPRLPGAVVVHAFPQEVFEPFELFRSPLPSGSPCFPDLHVYDGMLWLAYHDGSRLWLRNLTTDGVWDFEGHGNDPTCFGHEWFAWQATHPGYDVIRLSLRTGEQVRVRAGAPTGLSRILATGEVVTIDEDRLSLPGATIPSYAGDLAVGEGADGGCLWTVPGASGVAWPGRLCFQPKCAATESHVAISTHGPDVRVFVGSRAELVAFSHAPVEPPVDPPVDPVDPPVDPPLDRPTCAITLYPARVTVGAPALCSAVYGGGPATKASWMVRRVGVVAWIVDEVQEPPGATHQYTFPAAGQFDIALRVDGPGGSDETASLRRITVEVPHVPDPDPAPRLQVAFGPNIGSDAPRLFSEPDAWTFGRQRISCFHVYSQNMLNLPPLIGGCTYEALRDANAFAQLKAWGVLLEMETGSGPHEAREGARKAEEAGGWLGALAYDHTFTHIPPEDFAAWVRELRAERSWIIGAYVTFPSTTIANIISRVEHWNRLGARPDFLRMDIDPNPTERAKYTKAVHQQMRDLCDDFGIALQYVVNARDGLSDAAYCQQSLDWFRTAEAIGRWDARIVQSWAAPPQDGPRTIPKNLPEGDPAAFTTVLRRVLEALA